MSNVNPFIIDVDKFERDLDFVTGYLENHALYLSAHTGDSYEDCLEFVKKQSGKGGEFELKNPDVLIVNKDENGDRELREITLMGFVNRVVKNNLTLSPSLTSYLPEKVRPATHASYIEEGVKNRAKTKNEQIRLEGLGTPEATALANIRKGQQENYKLNNNSYSGAALSTATILYNKTTHPSLTSTCRLATSLSNAGNEKLIMGNRHYYSREITKANILSIAQLTNLDTLKECMETFNLHWPNADDVADVVFYSYKNYIHDQTFKEQIRTLAKGLTPLQRAAVVYVGDLYHVYEYNKEFVTNFLFELSQVGDGVNNICEEKYKSLDKDMRMFADFSCYDKTKGRNHERLRETEPELFNYIYSTANGISDTVNKYSLFIKALFVTPNLPSSIYSVSTIYRKAVPVSDTDSTMFKLDHWVEKLFGRIEYTPASLRLVFAMTFIISGCVRQSLAIQSTNMGVAKERLTQLAMKNEYYFAMLSLTNRSKHYYASQDALEGVFFPKSRLEIKGVGLRNSKLPDRINRQLKNLISDIRNDVKEGRSIHLKAILKDIAETEREIVKSVMGGSAEFLSTGTCKQLNGYKSPDNPTFAKHVFWKEVFADSFGEIREPPYTFFKVGLTTDNRTRFREWATGLEDKKLSNNLMHWHNTNGNKPLNVIHVPFEVVENIGIPKEIYQVADIRSIISQTMDGFYLVLEGLGIYLGDADNRRLVSDFY